MSAITMGLGEDSTLITQGFGEGVEVVAEVPAIVEPHGAGARELIEIIEVPADAERQDELQVQWIGVQQIAKTHKWKQEAVIKPEIDWKGLVSRQEFERVQLGYDKSIADLQKSLKAMYSKALARFEKRFTGLKHELQLEKSKTLRLGLLEGELRIQKLKISRLEALQTLSKISTVYGELIYKYAKTLLKATASTEDRRARVRMIWLRLRAKHLQRFNTAKYKLRTGMISRTAMRYALKSRAIHPKYVKARRNLLKYVDLKRLYILSKPRPGKRKKKRLKL